MSKGGYDSGEACSITDNQVLIIHKAALTDKKKIKNFGLPSLCTESRPDYSVSNILHH